MPGAGMLSIGALAKRAGVQAETIRYYETEGLLPRPERSASGYRLYGTSDVERLAFVRQARDLGFKLDAVRRLLGLADRKANTCDEVRDLAGAHLAEVRAKLADLRRMERVLSDLLRSCEGSAAPKCLLLAALSAPKTRALKGAVPAEGQVSRPATRSRRRLK